MLSFAFPAPRRARGGQISRTKQSPNCDCTSLPSLKHAGFPKAEVAISAAQAGGRASGVCSKMGGAAAGKQQREYGGGGVLCLPHPSRISLRKPCSLSDILSPTPSHKHTGTSVPLSTVTCVIRWAHARVVVDPVHTGSIVFTVVVLTVIRVDLTPLPLKAQRAGAASGMCVCRTEGIPGSGDRAGLRGRQEGQGTENTIIRSLCWLEVSDSTVDLPGPFV